MIVTQARIYGGLERLFGNICMAVRAQGGAVTLVFFERAGAEWLAAARWPDALRAESIDLSDVTRHAFPERLCEIVAQHRIDALCLLKAGPYEALPALRRRHPGLWVTAFQPNPVDPLRMNRLYAPLLDRIMVEGQGVADMLVAHGEAPERIEIIPSGILLAPFLHQASDPSLYRRLGLAPERPVLGYVGRLAREKNPLAFARLAGRLRDLPLQPLLIGSGPLGEELRDALAAEGLGGRVPIRAASAEQMPAILRLIDILVVPSLLDGRPQVIMEAMACGCVVVATAVGAIPELVADGRTGLVVPADDGDALEAAVRRLAGDPALRRGMAAAARETAARRFDLARVMPLYLETLMGPGRVLPSSSTD
jgi:glycosyltransferase involved in cell wall biosynthesis